MNYSVAPIANANGYIWTIPQGSTIVSGANTNSIVVNFSGSAVSGDISVYGTSNSCGNGLVSQNFHVTVVPTPTAVVASASPITVCEGQSLTLTGSASGATDWSWTGPNGYTSNDQNPSPITNISSLNAGVYTLVASNGICSAQPANTTSISVIPIPTSITASANPNPLCEGETLTLTGSATGATSWSWTGPNGFTSNVQNPSPISSISTAEAGVYSLVAYNGSCAAPAVNTANISVKPAPIADAGPDHSVVECGKIIGGNPTASGGVSPYTYQWSPTTALSSYTVANPTASPSSTTAYTVTVTGANGCASTSSMTLTIGNGTPVVFNSSQSWVVPSGVTCVQIEVWGGGGGGGGASSGLAVAVVATADKTLMLLQDSH